VLFAELDGLAARGVETGRLLVSASAHVIAPYNAALDRVSERFLGARRIGTTGRGIGPTYADKVNRVGIRVQDLFDESILRQKVQGAFDSEEPAAGQGLQPPRRGRRRTSSRTCCRTPTSCDPFVADTSLLLNRALDEGRHVLLEGSQGTLLDVDHGTYPFVTSSNPTSGGACAGAGIGPTRITRVIGILKAYTTRVGAGPFPTELHDADGARLRTIGGSAA
jgi:adenylosuccinate synthase